MQLEARKGRGRPREYCGECSAQRKSERERDRQRLKNPGWEERRAAANNLQREYRARLKAAFESNTEVTASDLREAWLALERAGLTKDRSAAMVPKQPNRPKTQAQLDKEDMLQLGHEGETTLAAEREKTARLRRASRGLWESCFYRDPLSTWASDRSERRVTPAFADVQATSGAALQEFATADRARGPGPKHAVALLAYMTGQLEPWQQKRYGRVVRKLDNGEIRDKEGNPIVRRAGASGNPKSMGEATVDLAFIEKEEAALNGGLVDPGWKQERSDGYRILDVLGNAHLTVDQIAEKTGLSKNRVYPALSLLKDTGRIRWRIPKTDGGVWRVMQARPRGGQR